MQASVAHTDVAAATAIFLTVIEIGGAVGAGISGAVWTANLPAKLAAYLPPELRDQASVIAGAFTVAQQYPPGTPARTAINRAYQETMDILLIIAACLCAPIVVLSFFMQNYKLDEVSRAAFRSGSRPTLTMRRLIRRSGAWLSAAARQ